MNRSTLLCFTHHGLVNPETLVTHRDQQSVLLVGDGSNAAYQHMVNFDIHQMAATPGRVGVIKTPRYEVRSFSPRKDLSHPVYFWDPQTKDQWFCAEIAAPYFRIQLSDYTSQSRTVALLSDKSLKRVCYLAYQLWQLLLTVEERLLFPAAMLDKLCRYTFSLTRERIDIPVLRQETGCQSLDYDSNSDILSMVLAGEPFEIKLSLLDEIYGQLILPFFNRIYGRRLRIQAAIVQESGYVSEFQDITYGHLGQLITQLERWITTKTVSDSDPIGADDLILFATHVRVSDDSCVWAHDTTTLSSTIRAMYGDLVFFADADDLPTTPQDDLTISTPGSSGTLPTLRTPSF